MEKTYNARLSFKGEGSFTFTLPGKGEVTIYQNRDIYVKGLSVSAVEALRELRPLLLDHKLNSNSEGCYSVIDLNSINIPKRPFIKANEPKVSSISELKSMLVKQNDNIDNTMDSLVDNLIDDMKKESDNQLEKDNEKNEEGKDETEKEDDKKEDNKKEEKSKSPINKSNSRGKGRARNRK